jgi:TPR repeat protein
VSHDDTEAVRWFRQAAEQGYAAAQLMLGAMYKEGKGVQPDYVQAHVWFNLGAARFPTSEAEVHELVSQARAYLATKMSPSQVATAQKLAREWRPK